MHGRMPANTNDAVFLILNYRKINTKTVPPLSLIIPLMPVTRRESRLYMQWKLVDKYSGKSRYYVGFVFVSFLIDAFSSLITFQIN